MQITACIVTLLVASIYAAAAAQELGERRYYVSTVFSWWPTSRDFSLFQKFVDESKQKGMNSVCIDVPWTIQDNSGRCDFTETDRRADYVVSKGMCLFLIANTTTLGGQSPAWLTKDMLQATPDGKVYKREADGGTLPSLAHPVVRERIVEFCRQVAGHYGTRWTQTIAGEYPVIVLCPAFDLSMQAQYSPDADVDYSPAAQADFAMWVKTHYGRLDNLNSKWAKDYKSWDEVTLSQAHPTARQLYFEYTLQRELDAIGKAVHEASDLPVGLLAGCFWDNSHRRTMNITSLLRNLDWLLVLDPADSNHAFSTDFARCSASGKKVASQMDAAGLPNATSSNYFNQGVRAFEHGARAVVVTNWDLASLRDNSKWPFLHFVGKLARYPSANPNPNTAIYISTWDLVSRVTTIGQYLSAYESLSDGGKKPVDLLSDYIIASDPKRLSRYSEIYLPANWTIPADVRAALSKVQDKLKVNKPLVAGTLDEYGHPTEPLVR
jgi:hypothetical protein